MPSQTFPVLPKGPGIWFQVLGDLGPPRGPQRQGTQRGQAGGVGDGPVPVPLGCLPVLGRSGGLGLQSMQGSSAQPALCLQPRPRHPSAQPGPDVSQGHGQSLVGDVALGGCHRQEQDGLQCIRPIARPSEEETLGWR